MFTLLDDRDYERQVDAWCRELLLAGAREADVLHLHHLTPINEAAARVAPDVPVVGQIHGTELLMLESIDAGPPAHWRYAERWATRMRAWANRCARLVVTPSGVDRAIALLGVPRDRVVALPNGVDTELFTRRPIDRRAFWSDVLVEDPQGWLPGQPAGSARYDAADVDRLAGGVALLYIGRFTAVKRLDRLIDAFGQAQAQFVRPATLILVGGHPGEWEGEHPADTAARLDVSNVYLAGWQAQERLPAFLSAADTIVLTSSASSSGRSWSRRWRAKFPPSRRDRRVRRRLSRTGVPAGWLIAMTSRRWWRRWSRRSTTPPSVRAEVQPRVRRSASSSRGRRSRSTLASCSTR